jgi:hypothetical protein
VLYLATLALAILGGIGLERLIVAARSREWRTVAIGISVSVVAAVAAAVQVSAESDANLQLSPGWPWLPVLAVGGLVLITALAARGRRRAAVAAALGLVVIDLITYSKGAVSLVEVEPAQTVRAWLGPPDSGRSVSICENRIGSGETLLNHQASLDGLAGIILDDYAAWANIARYGTPANDGLFHGIDSEGVLPARRDLIDQANVSLIISCMALNEPALTAVSHRDNIHVYRNDAVWPRAFWTCRGEIMTESAATERLVRFRYSRKGRLQPGSYIEVVWAPEADTERRREGEARYRLVDGVVVEGTKWRYVIEDPSVDNVLALMRDPMVQDTAGADRATGVIAAPPLPTARENGPENEMVIGTAACDAQGMVTILEQDQPDGALIVDVDAPASGFVFLSEPHYPERKVFVDGRPATAIAANLAFTAVEMTAGRHRLEMRYVPRSFYAGVGVTGFTLAMWAALSAGRRRRGHLSETGQ